MTRITLLLATGVIWAAMMATLVRRELIPYLAYQAPPSYRALLTERTGPQMMDADISFAGQPCGRIESVSEPLPGGIHRSRSIVDFTARLKAKDGKSVEFPVLSKSEYQVDSLYQLSGFAWRMSASMGGMLGEIVAKGERDGEKVNVDYLVTAFQQKLISGKQSIEIPRDTMLSDIFEPYPGGGRMYEGKRWKMTILDADLSGVKLGYMYAVVTGREVFRWQGIDIPGYRVEVRRKVNEDNLPVYIFFCREDGAAVIQKMTYQGHEYEITLHNRIPLTADALAKWNAKWLQDTK